MLRSLKTALIMPVLCCAQAIAIPVVAAERMFVALGDGNAVVVIDIATDKVIGRIEDVPAAHGLAGTLDGRYLIAGSSRGRSLDVAPPKPEGVKEEDHTAHHPPAAANGPTARPNLGSVTIIRQTDLTIARRIDVPAPVHHVAVSPDSRFAVVTHPSLDSVSVIDLTTFAVTATVPTGLVANYAAFSIDGSRLYVSNGGEGTVTELNTRNWKVTLRINVGREPDHLGIAPNRAHVYVNNVKDGTMTEIYLIDPKRTRVHITGGNPHGIDVSDDSVTVYVAAQDDNKLVAVNHKTRLAKSLDLPTAPYHVAVVRGRGKLFVSSAKEPKLWVIDEASFKMVREIEIGGKGHQMAQGPREPSVR